MQRAFGVSDPPILLPPLYYLKINFILGLQHEIKKSEQAIPSVTNLVFKRFFYY